MERTTGARRTGRLVHGHRSRRTGSWAASTCTDPRGAPRSRRAGFPAWLAALVLLLAMGAAAQGPERPSLEDWLQSTTPEAVARRDSWSMPDSVIAVLGLRSGDVVADLGCGAGYWSVHLARAVAPAGRVLALDVDPVVLAACRITTARDGVENVELRLVQADAPGLDGEPVDLVFMSNVWHILRDRIAYAERLRRSLPPDCRLAVLTWDRKLPAARSSATARPDRFAVRRAAEAAGYALAAEHDFITRQHFLVFRPGEAQIHRLVPSCRYANTDLLIGARPETLPAAFAALRERGFATLLDMSSSPWPGAAEAAAAAGLTWLPLPLDVATLHAATLVRFVEALGDRERGIVAALGDEPEQIAALLAASCEVEMLPEFLTSEHARLAAWAGERLAPMQRAVDAALE